MTRKPQSTGLAFLFVLGCIGWLSSPASAAIVLTSMAEVDLDETSATVVYRLFAGSDSSETVGVARYQVDVDLSNLAFYLSAPVTLGTVTPAEFPSEWHPQGPGAFGAFATGGATLNGNIISFAGQVESEFSGNVNITSHTETTLHQLGTIVMQFTRVDGSHLNLDLSPLNVTFEGYDPKVLGGELLTLSASSSGSTFMVEGINIVPEPGSAAVLLGLLTYPLLSRRRRLV